MLPHSTSDVRHAKGGSGQCAPVCRRSSTKDLMRLSRGETQADANERQSSIRRAWMRRCSLRPRRRRSIVTRQHVPGASIAPGLLHAGPV